MVVGLIVIAAAIYLYLPDITGANKNIQVPPPSKTENKNPPQEKAPQETPITPKGVNLTLNVVDNLSWMYVEIDGKPAFTGFLASGQVKEFKGAEKIYLKLGNAGVVEVEFNGQKMGVLGGQGEVVKKEFTAPQG